MILQNTFEPKPRAAGITLLSKGVAAQPSETPVSVEREM